MLGLFFGIERVGEWWFCRTAFIKEPEPMCEEYRAVGCVRGSRNGSRTSIRMVTLLAVQDGVGGVFAGGDGAFHEALPVGKVLAGKIGSEEGFFEDGHEGEPLSAAVDGVGTLGVGVVAPVVVGVF